MVIKQQAKVGAKVMNLVHYVRNSKGSLIGCVVAIAADNIGWSQCCGLDRFDKKRGLKIALGRAEKGSHERTEPRWCYERDDTYPTTVNKPNVLVGAALSKMRDRAKKYFKKDYTPGNCY